jgi:DNA-binding transcriptional LysR family regulator
MNIHHLELFYYVARFGGISEAVRNMPYGIQQPAVSGQILQLEEALGTSLFQRRPFLLTPQGEELFQFIKPFFANLETVAGKLRGGVEQHIRIGASEIILRDHLPGVLQVVRKQFPKLKVTLREGYHPQLESWLAAQELDVAITLLDGKPPAGVKQIPLVSLPLVLLVELRSPIKSAAELWRRDRLDAALISLPTNEAIYKNFQFGLGKLGVDWFTAIEVSTVELVETYVANGYGIGLSVQLPQFRHSDKVRVLPLPADPFAPVTIGALWQGRPNPLNQTLLQTLQKAAAAMKAP